ncbi:hypothetical protein DKX38_017329 [Salix brachista]|uniref:GDSL esterase/lipase n=1 Tax=Salix brachista TaxID=2182728 RepID=A0A5N5KUW9_9ROSI|nr:hypothetical protein DKX38_017329 [Salix brachista]
MACVTKFHLPALVLLIVLESRHGVDGKSKVPCFFFFGDSLVDSGNNNHLENKGKVNYLQYGMDFLVVQQEAFIKSFPITKGSQILEGVNYGSEYVGIQDETGTHMTLHDLGARKLVVIGVAPIGCTPNATAFYDTNDSLCVKPMNEVVILLNDLLKLLVQDLNKKLISANFMSLEIYEIIWKFVNALGTRGLIKSCCEVNNHGLCNPSKTPCLNRNLALFLDFLHPSEFLNFVTGTISYNALMTIL